MLKVLASIGATIALFAAPIAASANTATNSFTASGSSWVNVPEGDKVYFENQGSGADDSAYFYVPAGISCVNGDTYTGPMVITDGEFSGSDCTDANNNPYEPDYTDQSRSNALPFGFSINFYGTSYDSAWASSNGGVYFGSPDDNYDLSAAGLASSAGSSVMFPFGGDLWHEPTVSNFWTAQTTVDGAAAVVFSWEHYRVCCSVQNGDLSFQLVLIDRGNGDFDAYFNYDGLSDAEVGYNAPSMYIDLATDVTVGSNIVHTADATFAPTECTQVDGSNSTTYSDHNTDQAFVEAVANSGYVKQESADTISLWSDSSCTTPINPTALQDVANDGHGYFELPLNGGYYTPTAGWATFDPMTFEIDATELLRNRDVTTLYDNGSSPLREQSLNTDVPGRFVIGQRGGETVTDPSGLGGGSTPTPSASPAALATTGADLTGAVLALGFAAAGALFVVLRRRSA